MAIKFLKRSTNQSLQQSFRVKQPLIMPLDCGVYFNAYHFYRTLFQYDYIDIMCFTFNCNMHTQDIRIGRLVCNKMFGEPSKGLNYKIVSNVHTKLYLCYINKKLSNAFTGSWNFNAPSYLEIMTTLPEQAFIYCKKYFDEIFSCKHILTRANNIL